MSFNRTMKYFRSIRAYVFCDICKEVVGMDINKEDIRNGLATGLYIYKHLHKNDNADPDDPEDQSWSEHTAQVFINEEYDVKGIKSYFGDTPPAEDGGTRYPVVKKELSPMAVHLGMLTPDEFKILQICDGNNSMEIIAQINGKTIEGLEEIMVKLRDKGLVSIIKRG